MSGMKCLITLAVAVLLLPALAVAQSNPTYLQFGRAKGALYKPDAQPAPQVGLVVMHRTANYLAHVACTELSRRGFLMLCMNSRFENNENQVVWEEIALDVKQGVEYLRKQPGIAKVVLFGHSGGSPTMSFYQAVAENGTAYCRGPRKLSQCKDDLAGLPQADGIVVADGHPGQPVMVLRGLNPAVLDESNPPKRGFNRKLDAFDPRNGFNSKGDSSYPEDFQKRFFLAQSARMNKLIGRAQAVERDIAAGRYAYPDNDIIVVPRGGNPGAGPSGGLFLYALDPSIKVANATRQPAKLLKNDGSIVTGPVHSVVTADLNIPPTNLSYNVGTKTFSVKAFLSANAVRSTDPFDGVEHCSTNNSTICAVQSITVPLMVAAMGGFILIRDNEEIHDRAKSADKDFIVIEGANHGFQPCRSCEKTPGQYSNTVKNLFDYVAGWLNKRFPGAS